MGNYTPSPNKFPPEWTIEETRDTMLRYGENPHQAGAVYRNDSVTEPTIIHAEQMNAAAKDLSYVNYLDAHGALDLILEFDAPAAAVIKHTIPAGCATASTLEDAYTQAHATDPMSAYGGIVALNRECGAETADRILESPFKTIVIAPHYSDDGLEKLRQKESLRILEVGDLDNDAEQWTETQMVGGRLVQERDLAALHRDDLDCVTERSPTDDQTEDLLFAWTVVKHVMSNGSVFAAESETVGIGSGQPSRIDSVHIARRKATDHADGKDADGAVLATDGFAFPDTVELAADAGIEAIIQPGGSVRDNEVIAAADEHGIAMMFTDQRCFRHG